ncbi:MAG TPA: hypothetical protein VMV62_01755 [Candidatus Paceibacterota bacterium]|nr:hypothetical protein [Candidatus Paceibacterota bacterium]
MIRRAGTLLTFLSVLFFPWPLTAGLALGMALFEPLVPLAAGLFADTLYYVPHGGSLPLFTISGAIVTAVALFVHSRLKAGIMG